MPARLLSRALPFGSPNRACARLSEGYEIGVLGFLTGEGFCRSASTRDMPPACTGGPAMTCAWTGNVAMEAASPAARCRPMLHPGRTLALGPRFLPGRRVGCVAQLTLRGQPCRSTAAFFPADDAPPPWKLDNRVRHMGTGPASSAAAKDSGEQHTQHQQGPEGQKPVRMSQAEAEQMERELRSLNVAIGANILIGLAKVWVYFISGSSAMLAEALHSVADILNQVLLRVGVLKAMKAPTAQHPYGYMRDRFVWSLISAVGIFFLGSGASVIHGLHTLWEARVVEGAMWSYLVLGVSGLLEGYSLWVASRSLAEGARARGMPFLRYVTSGVDPTTTAVLLEDGGAVAGLAIAAGCTALTHATGNAAWDAVGSIAVGGLLGLIAVFLVQKNRDLLLGRSMDSQDVQVVMDHLRHDPVVLYVTDTKTEELGPSVYRFKAEVAWDGEALAERYLARCGRDALVARLIAAIEADRAAAAAVAAAPPPASGLVDGHAASLVAGTPPRSFALDAVLMRFGRDIINAVGAEVDRIEGEIQAINPGIRYVDLETDRGRGVQQAVSVPPEVAAARQPGAQFQPPAAQPTSTQLPSTPLPTSQPQPVTPLDANAWAAGVPGGLPPDASSGTRRFSTAAEYSCTTWDLISPPDATVPAPPPMPATIPTAPPTPALTAHPLADAGGAQGPGCPRLPETDDGGWAQSGSPAHASAQGPPPGAQLRHWGGGGWGRGRAPGPAASSPPAAVVVLRGDHAGMFVAGRPWRRRRWPHVLGLAPMW